MLKSLIAALALVGALGLTGCGSVAPGAVPSGMNAQGLQASAPVAFTYLAPFQGSSLKAGDEVVIAARVAYDLRQPGSKLSFTWVDGNRRPVAMPRHEVTLKGMKGETFETFKVKVASGTTRLTLVATAEGKSTVFHYSVTPASVVREEADGKYRSIR